MANISTAISKELFDNILPTFGNPRVHMPIWDEGQKMFLCDEHETEHGNRHYTGVRFCDRIVIVEKVGLYHSWTYIDSIELYAYNGTKLQLVQKRDYKKTFRNEEFIRSESQSMISSFFEGEFKLRRMSVPDNLSTFAKDIVEKCYKSYLDSDYNIRLTQILPQIELR